jgi:putative FmdB family regulatory protein
MPLYAYRCNNCGVQIERRQGFNDAPLKKCPECGENELRKLYSPVGILFKGPGFYATDHRSASGANGTSKKTENTEESEAGDKPAAKSEKSEASDTKVTEKKD